MLAYRNEMQVGNNPLLSANYFYKQKQNFYLETIVQPNKASKEELRV